MKFFADTASLEEIEYCFSRGVNDGITTNPKIIEATGDLSLGFENACKSILERYPSVPVSLETDLRGIIVEEIANRTEEVRDILLRQAYELVSWGKNVVIKIPICEGGLMAAERLSKDGIKTNVTACMTPYQTLEAAKAGATYASLFANRMLDSHIFGLSGRSLEDVSTDSNWKRVVENNMERYREEAWLRTLSQITYTAEKLEGKESQLIVGSIREPRDVHRIITCEPQVVTIPTKIIRELHDIENLKKTKRTFKIDSTYIGDSLHHPMTQYTLEEFEKSADSYRKVST